MAKNEQSREANQPVWFDGKSINEALFCDDFLGRHKIIYTNGAFFTPDGRVTDELPLRPCHRESERQVPSSLLWR